MVAVSKELTVGECGRYPLGGDLPAECPSWPPDAFAIVGEILLRSGAYRSVIVDWPPSPKWQSEIARTGKEWRGRAANASPPPPKVRTWWAELIKNQDLPLQRLCDERPLAVALIQLLAAADVASADAGLYQGEMDAFALATFGTLFDSAGRTLCRTIDPSRSVVLPKHHTPQTGLTFRSMTHHLALYAGGEMRPHWLTAPVVTDLQHVLLLPWPLVMSAKAFKKSKSDLGNLPSCYGFFEYDATPKTQGFTTADVVAAVEAAKEVVGGERIDAVILPELALRDDDYFDLCAETGTVVIGGIGRKKDGRWYNQAAFGFPSDGNVIVQKQSKHHRWRLDPSQVTQYELEKTLAGKTFWWEHIALDERKLHFLTLNDWLSVAVLICEDLARQEPVAELVRAVGPTLAVALLMDGPQLMRRWPGRYAAVLADDPGTSVLTLTSVGMAQLSHPKDVPPSSVFALWNDAKSRPREIEFKDKRAKGVVLNLRRQPFEEYTADGRSDSGTTSYLLLDGDPMDVIL